MKKRRRFARIRLTLWFSAVVFCIFLITAFITGVVGFIAVRTGIIDQVTQHGAFPALLTILLSCVLTGTVVSMALGEVPLKNTRKIIDAIKLLAKGDFSARLDISRPPDFWELADNFNMMAQELGSIEVLRTDFVNNFSHEFKTPIMSIKGFAEILKYGDVTEEEKNEYLDIIISESKRLSEVASNVLALSRVENQTILTDVTEFDLAEQIRYCMQLKCDQKELVLSAEMEDVHARGNEELLSQVWLNLLSNAVKFSPRVGL